MKIALIGGRGYTGAELLKHIMLHPVFELAFASSASHAGLPIREVCEQWPDASAEFIRVSIDELEGLEADAWVLAVPNGVAAHWAAAIVQHQPDAVVLDLSADHRFDDDWAYGLPEHYRTKLAEARKIANPGCYATAAQLALWPLRDLLEGVPVIFGVSGFSGAGKAPSPKNDPVRLAENLMPYALAGHVHELEVSHQLGMDVRFLPHVAAFFRGISVTVSARLSEETSAEELFSLFQSAYSGEPRIAVMEDIPEVAMVRNTPDAMIGGFIVDGRDPCQVSMVCVLDNLSKGAASQAIQNLNLAFGLAETSGLGNE